jgi:ribosome-binding factor A
MPEHRARTYHRNRVASTFSEEIGAMLEGELSDPRIAPSYVTDVVLAPGGKSARVFVAVHGSEAEEDSTLEGLMAARAFIRSTLRDRMGVRHVPDLTFAIDRSERLTGRMEELLARTRKRDKKREENAAKAAEAAATSKPAEHLS